LSLEAGLIQKISVSGIDANNVSQIEVGLVSVILLHKYNIVLDAKLQDDNTT